MRAGCLAGFLALLAGAIAQQSVRDPDIPDLKIASSNGSVTVSWPVWPLDLYLSTSQFAPTPTNQLSGAPGYVGDEAVVTAPATNTQQFFRLNSPGWFTPELQRLSLSQYAIFSAVDLEIAPSPPMRITAPIHCNSNIFVAPYSGLTFERRVTSANTIYHNQSPEDPNTRTIGPITYLAGHGSHTPTIGFFFGDNSPATLRQIVELPPVDEDPASELGRERFYNKADMIILVSDSGMVARSGRFNNFATLVSSNEVSKFVRLTNFFDIREGKTIKATEIDISKLSNFNANIDPLVNSLRPVIPTRDITILYVADRRTTTSTTESGVRLVNGRVLLPLGLTVATPNPLYILGHYNAPATTLGTTNTAGTKPAAVIADAINILSANWRDANSTLSLSSRIALNTTVNAALIAGNVPSNRTNYSGGIDNFPRLLEDWIGRVFTFNGSIAILFNSVYGNGPWGEPNVYNPPARNWSYDWNFMDPLKMPPGTPLLKTIRAEN